MQGSTLHTREFTRSKVAELSVDVHEHGAVDAGVADARSAAPGVSNMAVGTTVPGMAGGAGALVSRSSGLRGAKNDDQAGRVFGGDTGKTHKFAEGSFEDAKW